MPVLKFSCVDGSELRCQLESELLVGRDPGNDVEVADKDVSRQHCRFFIGKDRQVWVEDKASANGVYIDGERIKKSAPVPPGAKVVIGKSAVRLAEMERPKKEQPKKEKREPRKEGHFTREVPSSEPPRKRKTRASAKAPSAPRSTAAETGIACMQGLTRAFASVVVDLDRDKLVFGRAAPADVVLEDDSMSRKHAEVVKDGSGFAVKDLGSANGTFVNSNRVSAQKLESGDVVRFGLVEFSFFDPVSAAAQVLRGRQKKLIIALVGALIVGLVILMLVVNARRY
jgi:pSer/pThr/pTyr-binding forkhead associated (FHA) protein